jgi:hypothetical protein
MKPYIITAILCLFAFPAVAQDASFEVLCRTLPDAQAVSDVEYTPGVDVNGKAVVPADINALNATVPDVINIPVTVDLVQKYSLMNMQGVELKPDVSNIAIHKDGRVTYNGQDISKQTYSVCAKNVEIRETVVTPAPAEPKIAPVSGDKALAAAPVKSPEVAPQASGQPHDKSLDLPIVPKIAVPPSEGKDDVIKGQYP